MLKSEVTSGNSKVPSGRWRWRPSYGAALLLVLALALLSGCGGSSGGTDPSTAGSTQAANGVNGVKSFLKYTKSKGNKKIVLFGEEAPLAELEAASAVLTENLKARAAADFASQCSSLGKAGLKVVVGVVKDEKTARAECPAKLKKLAEPLKETKGFRINTLSGSIAVLRIKGDSAYALYHGKEGEGFAMPMEKEDGKWRVGAIATIALG